MILIPTVWMAVVFLGLAMCRLAARSDDSHVVALTAWLERRRASEGRPGSAENLAEELRLDAPARARRATG